MQHAFHWELLRKYTFGFLGVMRKGHAMHLIMFDLDGTLLKSNTLDEYCFSGAMISVMGIACTRALDFWGVSEFETVTYVGDGVWDLHASKKLGYHFIGIGSYNNEARLLQEGASFIINDYGDQKTFFAQMDKIWSRNNGNKWLTRF